MTEQTLVSAEDRGSCPERQRGEVGKAGLAVIWCPSLLAFACYVAFPPITDAIVPDSLSYIAFFPARTAGYPMFLTLVEWTFGGLGAVPYVQLGILCLSASLLAVELARLTGSVLAGLAALGLMLGNVEVVKYAFLVSTEALSLSLLMAVIVLIARLAVRADYARLASISLVVGVAILVRPVFYAALVLLLLLVPALRSLGRAAPGRFALAAAGPVVLMLAAGAFAYQAKHGSFRTQSFLGHNLFGKVTFVSTEGVRSRYPRVVALVGENLTPVREKAAQIDNLRFWFIFRSVYYDYLRYELTSGEFERLAEETGVETDDLQKEIALDIIRRHPGQYAVDVLFNYMALWTLPDLLTPAEAAAFDDLLQELVPIPHFEIEAFQPRVATPLVVYGVRMLYGLAFLITVLSMLHGFGRLLRGRPLLPIAFTLLYVSLAIHGVFALTALLQAGLPRYSLLMWPALVSILTVTATVAWQRIRAHRLPRWRFDRTDSGGG